MYKSLRAQTLHYFARPHQRIPDQPLSGPAAWHSGELQEADWQYRLSPRDVAELKAAVAAALNSGKPMRLLTSADFPLPTLSSRIQEWRREIRHGRGFVLVRGLPVPDWNEREASTAFWCIGHHMGVPGAQNPEGDLLGHVRDQRTGQDVRYYRTDKAIAAHCDAADVVGLLCLKPAKSGGLSRIASSVTIFNELLARHPELVPRLFRPFYFDTKGDGGIRAYPITPCAFAEGELRTFWQSDYFHQAPALDFVPELTGEEQCLLDTYDAIAVEPDICLDMDLQPGDMQLLSNHSIVHARTGFEDFSEPEQRRHLLRLWLSLPEAQPLNLRLLRAKSYVQVTAAALRELGRARLGF